MKPLIIHAYSDPHGKYKKLDSQLDGGDFLIGCGDFSFHGYKHEFEDYLKWKSKMKARYNHLIDICGNHEEEIERKHMALWLQACKDAGVHYLEDSGITLEGVNFWGSPVTPWFFDWGWNRSIRDDNMVYMPPRHSWGGGAVFKTVPHIKPHWDKIPKDTNVLITHGPPYGILDELVFPDGTPKGEFVGCPHLLEKIKEIKPSIHLFGHIHCAHGTKNVDGTSFYNAAVCDEMYGVSQPVTKIEYFKGHE